MKAILDHRSHTNPITGQAGKGGLVGLLGGGGRGKNISTIFLYAGGIEIGNVRDELKRGLGERAIWRRYQKPLYRAVKYGGKPHGWSG